jgi:hypothetical protein
VFAVSMEKNFIDGSYVSLHLTIEEAQAEAGYMSDFLAATAYVHEVVFGNLVMLVGENIDPADYDEIV